MRFICECCGEFIDAKLKQQITASDAVSLSAHWAERSDFLASGLVHYNWGDSEVVTVYYFIMGLSLVVDRTDQLETESSVRV